jgi:HlyD family secretion protein
VELTGPGILDAIHKVTITARTPGFLKAVLVDRNDAVFSGQLIAQIDGRDIKNELDGARASLRAASSSLTEAQSVHDKIQLQLKKASSDLERKRVLATTGTVSLVEVQNQEAAYEQAKAESARSVALQERSAAEVEVAKYHVEVLELKYAETLIHSPIEGVVISRERSVGALLTVGAPLLVLVDPKTIIISVRLDESAMQMIDKDQMATVWFASDPMKKISGRVLRVTHSVDTETREFTVDVIPKGLPGNWAIGQRANVSIKVPLSDKVIAIPIDFIVRSNGRTGVWKRLHGRAIWNQIEIGPVSGSYVQIESGVSVGDAIIDPKGRYQFEPVALSEVKG